MISDSLRSFAQSAQSTSVEIENGLYAPLLKFTKFTGVSFHRNSRFLIKLLDIGGAWIKTSEIYVATGENYGSPSIATIKNLNLKTSEVDYFIKEFEDSYVLYVRSGAVGCVVHAQVLYAENISFLEAINFEEFIINKESMTDIVVQRKHNYPDLTPDILLTESGVGYIKLATFTTSWNTVGASCAFSFCEGSGGERSMVAGDVYIKTRHNDGDTPFVVLKSAGTTDDFVEENINIIAVATNSMTVEIYLHKPKTYVNFQILNKFWNFTANGASIKFEEELTVINKLPDGVHTSLF